VAPTPPTQSLRTRSLSTQSLSTGALQALRLVADGGAVLILLPSLLLAPLADAAIAVTGCGVVLGVALAAHTLFRTARNLGELRRIVEQRETVIEHPAEAFLAPFGLREPPPVVRANGTVRGAYRVLRIPRHNGYAAFQYAPAAAFILMPCPPGSLKASQLFALLHEMGHIGARNLRNATAHAIYPIAPVIDPDRPETLAAALNHRISDALRLEWRNIRRRLARLQAAETVPAIAAILLFIHDLSLIEAVLLQIGGSFSGGFRIAGARLDAEVEADHYAISAMAQVAARNPHLLAPTARNPLLGRSDIVDGFMDQPSNAVRNLLFNVMRWDALLGRLGPPDAYLWQGPFRTEAIFTGLRFLIFGLLAVLIGARPISITPWLLWLYGGICGLLLAGSLAARRRSLARLDAALTARRPRPAAA